MASMEEHMSSEGVPLLSREHLFPTVSPTPRRAGWGPVGWVEGGCLSSQCSRELKIKGLAIPFDWVRLWNRMCHYPNCF